MSIFKRNNTWWYDFTAYGKRYRAAIPLARTMKQAGRAENDIKDAVFEGRFSKPLGSAKLAEFAENVFMPWSKANKRSWQTDYVHVQTIKAYFGKKTFAEIGPAEVEAFKIARMSAPAKANTKFPSPRKPATVNRELACLSKIFSLAVKGGAAASNPVIEVDKLAAPNNGTRFLGVDEEKRLLTACIGDREHIKPLIVAAVHTGMRRGELFNLEWRDVDLSRGMIYVRQSKSGRDRYIPINSIMNELLAFLQGKAKNGLVFPSPKSTEALVTIKKAFKEACKQAGITGLRFHDLRHTFASRLADSGANPFTMAELLGHADLRMTKRYTHVTDDRLRQAVAQLENFARAN